MNRKITLYTNHWRHHDPARRRRMDDTLVANVANPAIDAVVVLAQSSPGSGRRWPAAGRKSSGSMSIVQKSASGRPTAIFSTRSIAESSRHMN